MGVQVGLPEVPVFTEIVKSRLSTLSSLVAGMTYSLVSVCCLVPHMECEVEAEAVTVALVAAKGERCRL